MTEFAPALAVADAVLYEGYLLYPYTASARKNRLRWQFGVIVPEGSTGVADGEPTEHQSQIVLVAGGDPVVDVLVRFLQVEARMVEAVADGGFAPVDSLVVDGTEHLTWDEAIVREVRASVRPLHEATKLVAIAFDYEQTTEELRDSSGALAGRVTRTRQPLCGTVAFDCDPLPEPGLLRLTLRLNNRSVSGPAGDRADMLRTAFISAHTVLKANDGRFVSLVDPPAEAVESVRGCANRHTWPVLVGEPLNDGHAAALVLSSPIILYDFPSVNARTDTDQFDATEIDELLSLSVLSLSDDERREARATDPRARAIVERAERMGPEQIARLHLGALRRIDPEIPTTADDPFGPIDVPSIDCVFVDGVKVAKGSLVRLAPKRRADVWDMFLVGKTATVRAIHQDFEDQLYVAVTVDDDPARDLHHWAGRARVFSPDEVEPRGRAR